MPNNNSLLVRRLLSARCSTAAVAVKDIAVNRQAFHNYDILEKFEAVLSLPELKSSPPATVK
jgi:hypothetical protein